MCADIPRTRQSRCHIGTASDLLLIPSEGSHRITGWRTVAQSLFCPGGTDSSRRPGQRPASANAGCGYRRRLHACPARGVRRGSWGYTIRYLAAAVRRAGRPGVPRNRMSESVRSWLAINRSPSYGRCAELPRARGRAAVPGQSPRGLWARTRARASACSGERTNSTQSHSCPRGRRQCQHRRPRRLHPRRQILPAPACWHRSSKPAFKSTASIPARCGPLRPGHRGGQR